MAMAMTEYDDELYDDETYDDETFDDESYDDESEFLGQLLGGPAASIGRAIGGIFRPPTAPKPPLPPVALPTPGPGVSSAHLTTPQGNATLRLPEAVVTRQEFDVTVRRLQAGINRDAARVNTVAKDLESLRTRVGEVVTGTQRDITALRTAQTRATRAQRAAFARLRRDQSQQQMMTMVMSMMSQRSTQETIEDHVHELGGHTHLQTPTSTTPTGAPIVAAGTTNTTGEPTEDSVGGGSDNSMMMLMPLMMSQGGGGDNSMMLPMMMMAMNQSGRR
jgi:hypothetical protein